MERVFIRHPLPEEGLNRTTRFPEWLRRPIGQPVFTRRILKDLALNTVCEGARCPNLGECFTQRRATFMILGEVCTRRCLFCSIPQGAVRPVDPDEPGRLAEAARRLRLKHVVVTSVTRDDLEDGGASHFVKVIERLRLSSPEVTIEVLTPDFRGQAEAIRQVVKACPDIYNHNLETVHRLQRRLRPFAAYERSLRVLEVVKEVDPDCLTKSGIMVGLGETEQEVLAALRDLRQVRCNLLTIGQYLQSDSRNLPVREFVPPDQFLRYEEMAYGLGFTFVSAGPFVRSSYLADQAASFLLNRHRLQKG